MNPAVFLKANPRLNLALVFAAMAAIFIGSSLPGAKIPPSVSAFSQLLHALEYAVLAFLILPYATRWRRPIAYAVLIAAAYGVSDELHQLFVPGRFCDIVDVGFDCLGSMIGAFVSRRLVGPGEPVSRL